MRRVTPATVALSVLLATAPLAAAPANGAPAASGAGLPAGAAATDGSATTVAPLEANARAREVLRTRTRSKVLGTDLTMTVWDTATRSWVFRRHLRAPMRAASTTKILTSVGILHTLGPEHRFPTVVRAGAGPDEVVLVGGGDPLLTSADLRELAARTALALGPAPAAGAEPGAPERTIVVRADDSLFRGRIRSTGWPRWYMPDEVRPVRAFARDDNTAWDSTRDAGKYFATALAKLGVPANYSGEATAAPDAAVLATFDGHSVAEAVARMLLVSDNDTAEMLFRQIAVARGFRATWNGARKALTEALTELRIPLNGVQLVDGSGLSLTGRLTARALNVTLKRAISLDHPELAGLRGWLPVAGRTGTLQAAYKRFASRPSRCAAGLVQAKTGTLADAISLAGYAQGADGQTKIFVSIVNSRPTRYSRLQTRWAVDRVVSSVTGCW